MKDKITMTYIILSIIMVGAVTFYVAKLDISKMNSNITHGGSEILSVGEEYSKKLYNLAVAKMATEQNVTNVIDNINRPTGEKVKPVVKKVKPLSITSKQVNPIHLSDITPKGKIDDKRKKLVQVSNPKSSQSNIIFSNKKGENK